VANRSPVDNSVPINDVIPVPGFFHGLVRVLCALAILLVAGGQGLHAGVDPACAHGHETKEHSPSPDQQDCPVGHCCCNAHSCMNSTLPDGMGLLIPASASDSPALQNETWGDSPCREIDHPPQLS